MIEWLEVIILYMLLTVPSRIFKEKTFWDEYGLAIIICSCVALVMSAVFILTHLHEKKKEKVSFLVMHDGNPVDASRLVTVSMLGYQESSVLKGDLFVAPIPKKKGYSFAGWFYDSAFTRPYFSKKLRRNIVLYPKWIKHG